MNIWFVNLLNVFLCGAADGLNGWVVSRIDLKTKFQIDLFRLNSKHGLHAH